MLKIKQKIVPKLLQIILEVKTTILTALEEIGDKKRRISPILHDYEDEILRSLF